MQNTLSHTEHFYLFIGTYNRSEDKSIFVYRFNTANGEAVLLDAVSGILNPSFLTLCGDYVYAVSEAGTEQEGYIFAYHFDRRQEKLFFVNKTPSGGHDPCNLIADGNHKALFVTNYSSGSLARLFIKPDSSLAPVNQLIRHEGHSINPERQSHAYVHSVTITPDKSHIFAADLGLDKVFGYQIDKSTHQLMPAQLPFIKVTPGSGPRIIEFSPDGKYLYLIQEMGGQITVFSYHSGILKELQVISNLPKDYTGKIWGADIHVSPDGNFIYATNRDDLNDIVTYKRNKHNGTLTCMNRQPTGGKTPRNFVISPDGKYVLIGHQNSSEIVVFSRNIKTGMLTLTKEHLPIAHAVCLKMEY